jgi:hypothetical protein
MIPNEGVQKMRSREAKYNQPLHRRILHHRRHISQDNQVPESVCFVSLSCNLLKPPFVTTLTSLISYSPFLCSRLPAQTPFLPCSIRLRRERHFHGPQRCAQSDSAFLPSFFYISGCVMGVEPGGKLRFTLHFCSGEVYPTLCASGT